MRIYPKSKKSHRKKIPNNYPKYCGSKFVGQTPEILTFDECSMLVKSEFVVYIEFDCYSVLVAY